MAHSCGGSATASTLPLLVLDTPSRALALMIGSERAIQSHAHLQRLFGTWHQNSSIATEIHPSTRHHMAPTSEDVDSFVGWSDADVLQVLCGTHRLHGWASVFFLARWQ